MNDDSGRFAGRVVLITGATSGIGAACARAFARRGATLVLSGRDPERGRAIVAEAHALGAGAEFVRGDLRQVEFCDELVGEALAHFHGLDVVVNSAGIWRAATALQTTDRLWRDTMAVNLDALFCVSRAALRVMVPRRSGSIVNVASDWGLVGGEAAAAYCASKGAVVVLTKAMALDHAGDGIRINAVCPTDTDTPMMEADYRARGVSLEEGRRQSAASNPMGRMASADDVAAAVCFLASEQASFINGVALPVDGAATAR